MATQIVNDMPPQLPEAEFSEEFRDFVSLCLQKDPDRRPAVEHLLLHRFIRMYDDSIRPFDLAKFVRDVAEMRTMLGP